MRQALLLVLFASACAGREAPSRTDAAVDTSIEDSVTPDVALDGSNLPPGAADAFAANHRVFCRSFKACFPVQFANLYTDEDTCVARRLQASVAVFFGPGSTLQTSDIVACGKALGDTIACDDILRTYYENPIVPADCRLRGTHANGTRCAGSDQCKSGYCRYEVGGACGTCADRTAPGGSCTANAQCAEGLACAAGKCAPYVDRGGACDSAHPCHVADVCKGGVCVARLPIDAACDDAIQDCVVSAVCSSVSKTCISIQGGSIGAPCGYLASGGFGICDPGFKCKITSFGTQTGNCVSASKAGEACFRNGPSGSQCEAPLLCATTCTLPTPSACQ